MTLDPEQLVGRTIGPYQLDRLLGQGGFAWVFAARSGDRPLVALKLLRPRYAGDPAFDARFRKEAQVAADLHHPSIVQIHDIGRVGDYSYFTMPLYPDSLDSVLRREGRLPEDRLLQVAADLAGGLAFAHGRGFVHRDIKPQNVLLTADGVAVIADFGIAQVASAYSSATGVNMTIGTPQYISPEQAQGLALDGRSDLYALGVTLYKAATGEVPFRSTDWFELARMHVEEAPTAPRKRLPTLSTRFERVILKCLAKHPNDRYASADALAEELAQLTDQARDTRSFGMAPPGSGAVSKVSDGRGIRWVLAAVAVLVVVLVALLVIALGR